MFLTLHKSLKSDNMFFSKKNTWQRYWPALYQTKAYVTSDTIINTKRHLCVLLGELFHEKPPTALPSGGSPCQGSERSSLGQDLAGTLRGWDSQGETQTRLSQVVASWDHSRACSQGFGGPESQQDCSACPKHWVPFKQVFRHPGQECFGENFCMG